MLLDYRPSAKATILCLAVLMVIGGSLRVYGCRWGFPMLGHPDEFNIANYAARVAASDNWDPGTYLRPNHVSIYAHAGLYRLVSPFVSDSGVAKNYPRHILVFYRASRVLVALIGSALILTVFLIGAEFSPMVGLVGAGITAVLPFGIEHSHYITPDIPLSFFASVVILFCVKYLKTGRLLHLLVATAFAAAATAEKYPGLVFTCVIAVSAVARPGRTPWRKAGLLAGLGLLFIVVLFCCSPYLFIHYPQVVEALTTESRSNHPGADQLGVPGNLAFYLGQYPQRVGVFLAICTLAGFGVATRKWSRQAIPLYTPLFFLAVMSAVPLHWERWGLPAFSLLPTLTAIGALSVLDLARRARWTFLLASLAMIVPALSLVLQATYNSLVFGLEDTRVASLRFCQGAGIDRTNTIFEGYTPFSVSGGSTFGFFQKQMLKESYLKDKPFRYVMVSSLCYVRFFNEPKRYKSMIEGYRALDETCPRVARFESVSIGDWFHYDLSYWSPRALVQVLERFWNWRGTTPYQGPTITIYKTPESAVKTASQQRLKAFG